MKKTIIKARCISPGVAEGEALVSKSRISFWGGADVMKGIFTERGHELENCSFKDKILVFQSTKGSSGTSGMLKWSKINGVAPRAFINSDLDALAVLRRLQISYGCRAGGGCVLHHQNRGLGQG